MSRRAPEEGLPGTHVAALALADPSGHPASSALPPTVPDPSPFDEGAG